MREIHMLGRLGRIEKFQSNVNPEESYTIQELAERTNFTVSFIRQQILRKNLKIEKKVILGKRGKRTVNVISGIDWLSFMKNYNFRVDPENLTFKEVIELDGGFFVKETRYRFVNGSVESKEIEKLFARGNYEESLPQKRKLGNLEVRLKYEKEEEKRRLLKDFYRKKQRLAYFHEKYEDIEFVIDRINKMGACATDFLEEGVLLEYHFKCPNNCIKGLIGETDCPFLKKK